MLSVVDEVRTEMHCCSSRSRAVFAMFWYSTARRTEIACSGSSCQKNFFATHTSQTHSPRLPSERSSLSQVTAFLDARRQHGHAAALAEKQAFRLRVTEARREKDAHFQKHLTDPEYYGASHYGTKLSVRMQINRGARGKWGTLRRSIGNLFNCATGTQVKRVGNHRA
ncbi:unnamed protein product [Amoebophrya sp. A120]|nr:unnamed protein product [Amoebophrya sp. A120]|eukprot:GSA120T00025250001.1